MSFDLGDTWALTTEFRDPDGALANAPTVALTITWVDAAGVTHTVTPTIVNPPATTGVYLYDYVPTLAVRHAARWLVTLSGGNTESYTDVLDVAPADPGGIVSLAVAKAHLNMSTAADDEELRGWISSVTAVIEGKVGPVVPKVFTERVNTGTCWWLTHTPVLSLTSATQVLMSGIAVAVADLDLDPATGQVRRLDGMFLYGGPWTVTYLAGRPAVPANITHAALIILKHLWETQRGAASGSGFSLGGDDEVYVPGFAFSIPRRAVELLEPQLRGPMVA